jgi:hypothetical protein
MPPPEQHRARDRAFLAAACLFALVVPIALVLETHRLPAFRFPLIDAAGYHRLATALLEGRLPPEPFWQPPLYLFTLAGLYGLFGKEDLLVRCLHALLMAPAAGLLYRVARRALPPKGALASALLLSLHGPLVFFFTQRLPTGLGTVLVLLFALLFLRLMERPSAPRRRCADWRSGWPG